VSSQRRIGTERSESRAALVDAAQRLMLSEGYASVTSRKVAAEAGLKPQLVHYYFRTMDDLFLALLRRGAERNMERLEAVGRAADPLRGLWEMYREPAGSALTMEFAALVTHRPAVRDEFISYAERFRRREIELVERAIDAGRRAPDGWSAEALVALLSSVGRMFVLEADLGIRTGHDALADQVEAILAHHGSGPRGSTRSRRPR
jgi:AcrR family transcriptional regulator